MTHIRSSPKEHRLEIICLALIILFIVLILGLFITTAVTWRPPFDIEHGQRNSHAAAWSSRDSASQSRQHYRDESSETVATRRSSIAESVKELKNGLARNITHSMPTMDLVSWNAKIGDSL